MTSRVLLVVVSDIHGASLLRKHERFTVLFAAPSGTEHPVVADDRPRADDDQMINDDPLLLDYHTTARRLQLSERKVRELVASGELPAVSLGLAARPCCRSGRLRRSPWERQQQGATVITAAVTNSGTAALSYALDHYWYVLPLTSRGPAVPEDDSTRAARGIALLWGRFGGAGVGVDLERSGLVVVDAPLGTVWRSGRVPHTLESAPHPVVVEGDLHEWWNRPSTSVEARRALLALALERVEVAPVRRPGVNVFDPDRLTVVWRD